MKKILLVVLCFHFFFLVKGQETVNLGNMRGYTPSYEISSQVAEIQIVQDERISKLVNKHVEYSKENEGKFPGWRVLIYFDSGRQARQKAQEIRSQFMKDYPDMKAYKKYEEPFWKVLVGNFRTKSDALKFNEEIASEFKKIWVKQDMIEFPDLD